MLCRGLGREQRLRCSSGAPYCCTSPLPSPVLPPEARADPFSMDFSGVSRCSAPLWISHRLRSVSPSLSAACGTDSALPLGCSTPGSGHGRVFLGSRLPARVKAVFQQGVPGVLGGQVHALSRAAAARLAGCRIGARHGAGTACKRAAGEAGAWSGLRCWPRLRCARLLLPPRALPLLQLSQSAM